MEFTESKLNFNWIDYNMYIYIYMVYIPYTTMYNWWILHLFPPQEGFSWTPTFRRGEDFCTWEGTEKGWEKDHCLMKTKQITGRSLKIHYIVICFSLPFQMQGIGIPSGVVKHGVLENG